jgi:signal peptidase I
MLRGCHPGRRQETLAMSDNQSPRGRRWTHWMRQLRGLVVVVLVLTAFRSAVADWNDVPTGSMRPTILEGDRILVNKLAYDLKVPFTTWRLAAWSQPDRGDVVIFLSPQDGTRLVKRVIGLPGDVVEMRGEKVLINGTPADYARLDPDVTSALPEEALKNNVFAWETLGQGRHAVMATPSLPAMRSFGPVRVPDRQFLVLGDNRDNSKDSRYIGFIPRDQIVGQAVGVALSLDPDNYYLPRWSRWGRPFAH